MAIWLHLVAALLAVMLGLWNLAATKGTFRHRLFGWIWVAAMVGVTLPSFWIRELSGGELSWIHALTAWTIFCMIAAIAAIKAGSVRTHANFMIGTMVGALIAGGYALMPGRFVSKLLGYG